jgi:hypothetical protein
MENALNKDAAADYKNGTWFKKAQAMIKKGK